MSKVEQMKMTKVQYRAVKDLAVRMCANYDRPTGDCLLMDEACWQVCCSSGLCRYFKEAVLPLDRVLYADLVKPVLLRCVPVAVRLFLLRIGQSIVLNVL